MTTKKDCVFFLLCIYGFVLYAIFGDSMQLKWFGVFVLTILVAVVYILDDFYREWKKQQGLG